MPASRGERRKPLALLVGADHRDAPSVAVPLEVGRQEHLDQPDRLLLAGLAAGEGHDVRVVVPAGERGGVLVPGQRGPDALDLVRGDLLAVATATEDHAEAARVAHHALRRAQDERRVVVLRVVDQRAVVDDLMPLVAQPGGDRRLALVAGVVAAEVHAHTRSQPAGTSGATEGWLVED